MTRYTFMPQCLGSGHTKLCDKVRLVMHLLWMHSRSPRLRNTRQLADSVVSFTTDFGVELGLADVRALSLKDTFAPWMFPARRVEHPPGPEGEIGDDLPVIDDGAGFCGCSVAL
jgi:hypothetical protein